MATKKKLLQAAAGAAGEALNVEDVFSTYIYDGTGSTNQTITNGIDLSGEGGLVWAKARDFSYNHFLVDTERGGSSALRSDSTAAPSTNTQFLSFNSNGYEITSSDSEHNNSIYNYVSWTFRKAPKFFDVVTYTGNGSTQSISHNLGSVPGVVIVKNTDSPEDWWVYHRSVGNTDYLELNATSSTQTTATAWNNTTPTDTQFTVGSGNPVNENAKPYVAYLFAHNDGDGDFGPTGDQDIIKCGSYTGAGSTDVDVDLGFEPQWVLIKKSSAAGDQWLMLDSMRGTITGTPSITGYDNRLFANLTNSEAAVDYLEFTETGFRITGTSGDAASSGATYIYIAIRRGPMAVPESATDVFAIDTAAGTSPTPPTFYSGWPVDFHFYKSTGATANWNVFDRLRGDAGELNFNLTNGESSNPGNYYNQDLMDGVGTNTTASSTSYQWMWRRAPNFFDIVCYRGTGSAQNITHNLGATPEFYIVKRRDSTGAWYAYHKDIDFDGDGLPETDAIQFNGNTAAFDSASYWNDTAPTETTFTVGTTSAVNGLSAEYVAYLFTSLDGVAKVGGYTGNGTSQTINCGFAPRFVFLTKWGPVGGGNKLVWDTERGIVAGNDPFLDLRSTAPEDSSYDFIDPDSNGFVISGTSGWVNASGDGYMFYAIA